MNEYMRSLEIVIYFRHDFFARFNVNKRAEFMHTYQSNSFMYNENM
jgi:hypothetical protein